MLIFQKPDLEAECLCWQGLSFYNYLKKCYWRRPFLKKAQFLKESNFSMLFKFCLMKWFLPTFKSKSSQQIRFSFHPPGYLPNPGIEPMSLMSPALAGRFFTTSRTWEAQINRYTQVRA